MLLLLNVLNKSSTFCLSSCHSFFLPCCIPSSWANQSVIALCHIWTLIRWCAFFFDDKLQVDVKYWCEARKTDNQDANTCPSSPSSAPSWSLSQPVEPPSDSLGSAATERKQGQEYELLSRQTMSQNLFWRFLVLLWRLLRLLLPFLAIIFTLTVAVARRRGRAGRAGARAGIAASHLENKDVIQQSTSDPNLTIGATTAVGLGADFRWDLRNGRC